MNIRLQQHRAAARRGSDLPVHCAWRKHGEPSVQVLGEYDTHEALHRAEIEAIARLGTISPGGYNVSVGGDTAPSKNSAVAQKIAEKAKGRKHADTSAWVESTRKQWQNPDYRAKVSAGVKAAITDEHRAAQSERTRTLWERRRADGWQMPEETKAKIRQRVFSPEAIAKMSASAKRRGAPKVAIAASATASKGKKRGPYDAARVAKAAEGVKAAWADPVKRERLVAARKAAWETRRKAQQEAAQ